MSDLNSVFQSLTEKVTKEHARHEKSKIRGNRGPRMYHYSDRVNFTDVMGDILPDAYLHASGGGTLPAANRQIYYAARDEFRERTGREITQNYLCQTLLPRFINENPKLTKGWKITADPRGKILIANTKSAPVPCGTLSVDKYLSNHVFHHESTRPRYDFDSRWPGNSPGERFQAVLYIEKEGFEPLLEHANIASRFNIAIVSCKGQSVVAARKFVDHVCGSDCKLPLLIAHDFDLYGFQIAARLTKESQAQIEKNTCKYFFENPDIPSIDIGLRLADVEAYELGHEKFTPKDPIRIDKDEQREFGMTDAEAKFLESHKRVELNAFTSPQFIEWLESKLRENGICEDWKPPAEILKKQYERAMNIARVERAVTKIVNEQSEEVEFPEDIEAFTATAMQEYEDLPWDRAIATSLEKKLRVDELRKQA